MNNPRLDQLFQVPEAQTEREYQSSFQRLLTREGWLWVYVRRMRTPDGRWMTGTSDPGWLDILALRRGFVLAAEMKSATGKVRPDQLKWLKGWYESDAFAWVLNPKDDRQQIANWVTYPESAPKRYGW